LGFAFNAHFLTLLSVILLPFYSNSQTRKFVHSACCACAKCRRTRDGESEESRRRDLVEVSSTLSLGERSRSRCGRRRRGDGGHGELAIWIRFGFALLLPLLPVGVRRRIIIFLNHHVRARLLASPSYFLQRHVDVHPQALLAFAALGPLNGGDQWRSTCNQMSIRCQSDAISAVRSDL